MVLPVVAVVLVTELEVGREYTAIGEVGHHLGAPTLAIRLSMRPAEVRYEDMVLRVVVDDPDGMPLRVHPETVDPPPECTPVPVVMGAHQHRHGLVLRPW